MGVSAAVLLLLAVLPAPQGRVLRVDADATGSGTGATWRDAIPDLQEALRMAGPGDELWIAEGEYRPTDGVDRDASFWIRQSISLVGGFAGTETTRAQADPDRHPTVLTGAIGSPGREDNSRHVLRVDNPSGGSVELDGLSVRDGDCSDWEFPYLSGAGMVIGSGSVEMNRCLWLANYSALEGGAIYCLDSLTASDCDFLANEATHAGGAIFVDGDARVELIRCNFTANRAFEGGAIRAHNWRSVLKILDCLFENNVAHGDGGAVSSIGLLDIDRCRFIGNVASSGGGLYCQTSYGKARIANSLFARNSARSSGTIYLDHIDDRVDLLHLTITQNRSAGVGSVRLSRGFGHMVSMVDCILWQNGVQDRERFLEQLVFGNGWSAMTLLGCCIQGLRPGEWTGNTGIDPRFRDPARGDYRLRPDSPLIDRAHPDAPGWLTGLEFDLAGRPRIQGAAADVGAFEVR